MHSFQPSLSLPIRLYPCHRPIPGPSCARYFPNSENELSAASPERDPSVAEHEFLPRKPRLLRPGTSERTLSLARALSLFRAFALSRFRD